MPGSVNFVSGEVKGKGQEEIKQKSGVEFVPQ